MLRAIVFDFDGVIVNSEPLILRLTQEMAAQEGWTLSEEEYYRHYLALDDRGIVERLYHSHGREIDATRRDELVAWKARVYQEIIRDGLPAMPGVVEFISHVARDFLLAIASGSLRSEVEYLLRKLGLRERFTVLATAEDFERSKPDPEVFVKALAGLQALDPFQAAGSHSPLRPGECLAIEDAPAGIVAAHAAGMKCLALSHTRPQEELAQADWVCRGFDGVDFPKILAAFELPTLAP